MRSEFGEISSVLSQKYRNFTSNFPIYLGLFHHKKKFVLFSISSKVLSIYPGALITVIHVLSLG